MIAFNSLRDDANGDEVYIMNADGSDQKRLNQNRSTDMAESWSPDGKQIAFISNRDGNFDIYIMNVDGTGLRRLTSNPEDDSWPVWSPDGKKIAYDFIHPADYPAGQSDLYPVRMVGRIGQDVLDIAFG